MGSSKLRKKTLCDSFPANLRQQNCSASLAKEAIDERSLINRRKGRNRTGITKCRVETSKKPKLFFNDVFAVKNKLLRLKEEKEQDYAGMN